MVIGRSVGVPLWELYRSDEPYSGTGMGETG